MSEETSLPGWKASTSHPELVEKIRKALRQVRDPEIGNDIIELGLVRDVEIAEKNVVVTMILTTPYCPYGPALMESARRVVEKESEKSTTIIYGNEIWDQSMMEDSISFNWGLF
ncbi:MAG TPA: iron-sulfur cluster assembly protein [Anaerolineaceae bacterium]|jgi:metal-sulfur cluster biosynthetic enzyme|nr:iron-sulfur cluster assembly protein [Anaerolineaceae bacterium]